jgi:hypothetical protein
MTLITHDLHGCALLHIRGTVKSEKKPRFFTAD